MADVAQSQFVTGADFLTPPDLATSPELPVTALLIGSCFLQTLFLGRYKPLADWQHDLLLINAITDVPQQPPRPVQGYDFQLIQLPLRSILPTLTLASLDYDDLDGHQTAFEEACESLRLHLAARMRFNIEHGLLSFVCNFMQPQMPSHGLLLPRYDLRNLEHFVAGLNQELARLLAGYTSTYLLDLDRLAASFGRRHVQDDSMVSCAHNAQAIPHYRITGRLKELAPLGFQLDTRPANAFRDALFAHVRALHRAVLQPDPVKLVVTDLDDTLWKGIAAECDDPGPHMIEGWPYGLIEALLMLRRRGILLGIISRNDGARIRDLFPAIMGDHLALEDFADRRINFQPKPDNMAAMLAQMNILPRHVVFIDDNPAERAQMQAAFPDIRVLGGNPFHTRRILLLAAQTQTASVTPESARRTTMMQAQMRREHERASMDLQDFIQQQDVRAVFSPLTGHEDKRFARTLELINKTNQFNTTGQRWTAPQLAGFMKRGGRIGVVNVTDRYTEYGLTGVVLRDADAITQLVMSCRVLGMGVERCMLRAIAETATAGVTARLVPTDINKPCHGLFRDNGFVQDGETWRLPAGTLPPAPAHVTFRVDQA